MIFFIFDEIRFDRIDSILSQMRNKNLFNVQLDFRASSDIKVPKIQSICDTWLCSFQPTLWNVDFLNKLLRRHESIWAFEKHASIRAKKSGLTKFFGTV